MSVHDQLPYSGTIKFWKEEKFYGFVAVGGGDDVFLHISAWRESGIEGDPQPGSKVDFSTKEGRNGKTQVDKIALVG